MSDCLLRPRGTRACEDRRTPLIHIRTNISVVRANDRRIPITRQRNRIAKIIVSCTIGLGDRLLRPRGTRACEDRRTPLLRIIPLRANDRSIPITRQRNRNAKLIVCGITSLGDCLLRHQHSACRTGHDKADAKNAEHEHHPSNVPERRHHDHYLTVAPGPGRGPRITNGFELNGSIERVSTARPFAPRTCAPHSFESCRALQVPIAPSLEFLGVRPRVYR